MGQGSGKARVLVAAVPELDARVRDCLPGHDITFVRTMFEAVGALRHDGFQLLVIELNFDESRMFELLQHIRAQPKYQNARVVCVYGDHLNLSESVVRNINVAVKALGGEAFLDLREGSLARAHDCATLDRTAAASAAASAAGLRPN
jgi:CheY-like chemotaxis protein